MTTAREIPRLIMLVGLPASGKNTYANELKSKHSDWIICGSDEVRQELYNDSTNQTNHAEVFRVLHKKIKNNLSNGKTVIYDATNINSKQRRAFLNEISHIKCKKDCVILATPYEQCLQNNKLRERQVPKEVIKRRYMNWNTPYYFEGWDYIFKHYSNNFIVYPNNTMNYQYKKAKDFDQKNHHHTKTLGEHMDATVQWLKYYSENCSHDLLEAARYHDCGKMFTQVFHNSKGEPTKEAHYYQHHCVGAYDCLCDKQQSLLTSVLINLHMQPYFWQYEKTKEKYKRIWGEELFAMVMKLHEADMAAH